ncbi:MAG: molybdenum cofactor biosynthesis protein MoaE [Methanomicrobiales archaeon]
MIKLQQDDFDVGRLVEAAKSRGTGAIVTFTGIVRDDGIEYMELEAYHEVAEHELTVIRDEAMKEYPLHSVDIIHRTGPLRVGDNIVLIVVSAGHRKEAFLGCEYVINRLKQTVPIWKKEYLKDRSRWVEGEERPGHAS